MIKTYTKAAELTEKWNDIFAENNYISKSNLDILESCNPCNQKYVIINERSAFVEYELKLNIFSYSKTKLNLKVNIIGIPCSVSKEGYKIQDKDINELEEYIKEQKKPYIILNSEDKDLSILLIKGETLPTCKVSISWDSFDDFMRSLRSHYRYRLNKALKKGREITIKRLNDNSLFDENLYSLYKNVYNKSDYKLEKLGIDFFKKMSTSIYTFYVDNKPVAFVQLSGNNRELCFVFGGIDYSINHKYDLYMNMLIFILRYGIENKYLSIDMGQTAEDAKMKLGCKQYKKYMYIYHPNLVIRSLIRVFSKRLSYKQIDTKFNIFKEID